MIFFDVDGTLSVPVYRKNDSFVIGFPDDEWLSYCRKNGKESYQYCKPVLPVKRYAEARKAEGAMLCILTTSQTEEETSAKSVFIDKNYPNLFSHFISVSNDAEKISVILRMAEEQKLLPEQCELVEDSYATLLAANNSGIQATHISSIVCDL